MDELTMTEEAPSAPVPEATLSMIEAGKYLGVGTHKLLGLARDGKLPGASKEPGRTGNWSIPLSVLDEIKASGIIKLRKPYTRRNQLPATGRLSIKDAAKRFGIGLSTLQKKAQEGILPSTMVQTGPRSSQRFVNAKDVAALELRSRGQRMKRPAKPAVHTALPKSAPPAPPANLASELLRISDMVASGMYRVTKLSVGLEFVGPEE